MIGPRPDKRFDRALEGIARRVLLKTFLTRVDRAGASKRLADIAADRMADRNTKPAERKRLERYH